MTSGDYSRMVSGLPHPDVTARHSTLGYKPRLRSLGTNVSESRPSALPHDRK
jgi:hypothetical protein